MMTTWWCVAKHPVPADHQRVAGSAAAAAPLLLPDGTVIVIVTGRGLTPRPRRAMVVGKTAGQGAAHVVAAEVMVVVLRMAQQQGVRLRQMAASSLMLS